MRLIPALAALVAAVAKPLRRAPKRTVIETPLKDALAPAVRRSAGVARMQVRRGRSKPGRPGRGFLRALQHVPMLDRALVAPTRAAQSKWRNARKRARRAAR